MNKINKFIWFGNDADGFSMVDFLALGTFICWIIAKAVHLMLSITYRTEMDTIVQLNLIMGSVDAFMGNVLMFYFGKKTVDTAITKVGLFTTKQYKMPTPPPLYEASEDEVG